MDLSVLPEIFALSVLFCLFLPIVRRVRRNAAAWMCGWGILLIHYVARALIFAVEPWHDIAVFSAAVSLPFAALCFLRAADTTADALNQRKIDWAFTAELALPLTLQCALTLLPAALWLECTVAVALLVPAFHLWLRRRAVAPPLAGLATAFAFASPVLLVYYGVPAILSDFLFLILCCGIAATYIRTLTKFSRTSGVAAAGLLGWGLSYLVRDLVGLWVPTLHLSHDATELPQYVFAAGTLLALIEQLLAGMEHLAMHDALTGLANRRRFEDYADGAIRRAGNTGTPLAFLVIDVDEFKRINDTLGHHVGDELLRSLAVRLSWNVGPNDILARTGGDEFTAILAGVSDVQHLRFVARAMMSAASVPFIVDGLSVNFHISMGVAIAPYDANDILSLRKAADEAMYQAKGRGGSRLVMADEGEAAMRAG